MKSVCLETDPVLLLSRDRSYHMHKDKLASAEKIIDNNAPNSFKLPKFRSKSPMQIFELDQSNSRIYNRLNEIYHKPSKIIKSTKDLKSATNIKSTTSINRSFKNAKISTENENIQKRLSSQKATLSFKQLKRNYKESKEFKQMISKFNRMESNKKLVNSYRLKLN